MPITVDLAEPRGLSKQVLGPAMSSRCSLLCPVRKRDANPSYAELGPYPSAHRSRQSYLVPLKHEEELPRPQVVFELT